MTGATAYRIETNRLVVRCFQPDDAARRKDAVDVSRSHLLSSFRRWPKMSEPLEAHVAHIRGARGRFDLDQDQLFGIFDPGEARCLGEIGLLVRAGPGAREVGYWIRVDETRQGYAGEALAALVHVALHCQDIERLDIRCASDNVASAAVARTAGFVLEGTLRHRRLRDDDVPEDDLAFSLIRRDLEERPPPTPLRAFDIVGRALL